MLPANRRQEILDILSKEGSVAIGDLSQRLDVSEMTIHRDLNQLADEGLLRRVRGGAMPLQKKHTPPTHQHAPAESSSYGSCVVCNMTISDRLQTTLLLADGTTQHTCCAHCALLQHQALEKKLRSILVTDFLHGRRVNGAQAWFVIEPNVTVCCTPAVLTFGAEEDAQRFQKGFGGQVMQLEEAGEWMSEAMAL